MMFSPGILDGWDFETGDRPTWPPVGTRLLVVEDRCDALFFTATWTVVAKVDDEIVSQSSEANHAHSQSFIKRWARQAIRSNYVHLRQLGVDADKDYVSFGGKAQDLHP